MRKIWFWLLGFFVRRFSDEYVESKYKRSGAIFGDATSYSYLGECVEVNDLLENWEFWEKEYARRGYKTISLKAFIDYGGWGQPLSNLGIKRTDGEKPVYHAGIYRERFLGKIKPLIDMSTIERGGAQIGHYITPNTEE